MTIIERFVNSRINRREYFIYFTLTNFSLFSSTYLIFRYEIYDLVGYYILFLIFIFILKLVISIKRLHDIWLEWIWVLFPFVQLFMFFSPGEDGINKYWDICDKNPYILNFFFICSIVFSVYMYYYILEYLIYLVV